MSDKTEERHKKIIAYVKKGMGKGFNAEYIRSVLLKHGYPVSEIDFAIASATKTKVNLKSEVKEKEERLGYLLTGSSIVIVVLIIALILSLTTKAPTVLSIDEVELSEESLRTYIDKLGKFSISIEAKQEDIEKQLQTIHELDLTIEEKETIISAQLKELDELFNMVKAEREYLKSTLLELINAILNR